MQTFVCFFTFIDITNKNLCFISKIFGKRKIFDKEWSYILFLNKRSNYWIPKLIIFILTLVSLKSKSKFKNLRSKDLKNIWSFKFKSKEEGSHKLLLNHDGCMPYMRILGFYIHLKLIVQRYLPRFYHFGVGTYLVVFLFWHRYLSLFHHLLIDTYPNCFYEVPNFISFLHRYLTCFQKLVYLERHMTF